MCVIQSIYYRNQCYVGHIGKIHYASTVPFNVCTNVSCHLEVWWCLKLALLYQKGMIVVLNIKFFFDQERELYRHLT